MRKHSIALLIGACGLAVPALAQDSVSNNVGLPGDGLNPFATGEQVNRYVVDLATLTSSWGNTYGIAPVVKFSKSPQDGFFSVFAGSQAISLTQQYNVRFPAQSYGTWSVPGQGINADENNAPGDENIGCARGLQFAVAAAESEFNSNLGADYNGVVGAVVNYDPRDPAHLYVSRTVAAVNGTDYTSDNARIYIGSVDDDGNVHMRTDGFSAGGADAFGSSENSWFRVDMESRSGVLNSIGRSGGGLDLAATVWIDLDTFTDNNFIAITHNPMAIMPESLYGRAVALGGDFNDEYVWESAAGTTSFTQDHLNCLGEDDHRGNLFFSNHAAFGGSVGTAAMLGHSAGSPSVADAILLWGVDADGTLVPGLCRRLTLPATIADPVNGVDSATHMGPWEEFGNFRSQVAFQGGNGQVAVGRDQAGRTIVAAMVKVDAGLVCTANAERDANPSNAIVVARITGSAEGGAVEWTLAGYSYSTLGGKEVTDGAGNNVGRMIELYQITGGTGCSDGVQNGRPFGPSISSPAIDSVGNVYFIASCELYDDQGGIRDRDNCLIRAVYDPATNGYELEKLLELGTVFTGPNSGTPYAINFLEVADSNSASSATFYSGNVMQQAAHGRGTAGLDPSDPQTLGGLVFWARIVYDSNGDGEFITDTDPVDQTPSDEAYAALMYLGPITEGFFCPADVDGNRSLNVFDFLRYQTMFSEGDPNADFDCNGLLNVFDFLAFQTEFNSC